ncbi:CRAL/TRIO domain-containing protein, partial [Meira miltonrushii]
FDGIFPVPHPDCKPTPPAKLTEEQQQKYEEVFEHFKSQKDFPVSLKPEEKRREPLSDWEKLRMVSKESMLRYLRATKWDVRQAKRRLTETIAWRREFGVENLNPEEMAKEARCGKETVLGYDKYARPVHYMHPHRSDTKESPRQMQFAVFLLERCIDMMPPGVEQLALLINFEHKSRNPTSIANAKLMLYILQNHYVENLGVNWSVNVPWVFKVFWNAIQPFIDPVTKNKCHFDDPVRNQVPADQLSADFGGDVKSAYDHDAYWPALLRITKDRRDAMLRRFKEDCNSEIGASEWVIRGGDDPN